MRLQVGIDLVSTDEVEQALMLHGDRYLERIYTEAERAQAGGRPLALAERFAAKEATMKALRRGDEPLSWQSIAVDRDPRGRPSVRLSGAAHELARRAHVKHLSVSLARGKDLAAALVVAELER